MTEIVYRDIVLRGKPLFMTKTKEALDYIETNAPRFLPFVVEHIGVIAHAVMVHGGHSGVDVYAKPPIFYVAHRTFAAGTSWYASCIVHDATHVKLYREGKPHSGREAEDICLEHQKQFLTESNSGQHHIKYIQHLIDDRVDYFSKRKRNW